MKRRLLLLAIPLLALASCGGSEPVVPDNPNNPNTPVEPSVDYLTDEDSGTATVKIFKDESATQKERYISPKNVEVSMTFNTISGTLSNNENVCPSIGDVNLLVIPVHLPGSTYNTEEIRNDIETAFFGKDDSRNGYYSLSEYYYESSFGKLNFDGLVTDWFDVAENTNIKSLADITMGSEGTIVTEILRKAVAWVETKYQLDLTDYDQNNDGSIDGVWLVYDHLNYFNQMAIDPESSDEDINEAFWNFTSWDWYGDEPNLEKPTTSGFSWSSFDQLYSAYTDYSISELNGVTFDVPDFSDFSSIPLDSHTYIHETGHLLGLDDLYTRDSRRPTGSSNMMDQNVGDFDPYSKLALGWITPYVVYGSSEILLPYNTYDDHSVIVIPSNWEEISAEIEDLSEEEKENYVYKFNPFSEYIMIDLYSPLGLNYKDTYGSDGYFVHGREACIADTGVRIWHVDSRIFKCTVVNSAIGQRLYWDYDNLEWNGEQLEDNEAIIMAISNERNESQSFQLEEEFNYYERLRLLEAHGTNTFDLVSTGMVDGYATGETLWKTDSNPFDIYTYGFQFFNAVYTFNIGSELPFKISVETLVGVDYE